ncbi:MAG: L-serine ammonia-lyase, iron-sulfur-dependent, subunit alpha [Spirochaetales bacterium]|nr:L-serine ammonia-lyase, iron-sulfur-dependent, subunit alpha [Spirochaetales bacterium]MBQ9809731.1 L-serine ammonia-lyase, iron-sulfur-dependent, subunit alpha [Spirochaetales bacterium]
MKSIKDIYKIGKGPSSSHTMGPGFAAKIFKDEHPDADSFRAVLYGSLAKTGIGHGTDRVLIDTFAPTPVEVEISSKDPEKLKHPNTLDLVAVKGGKEVARQRFISIGGGDIVIEGRDTEKNPADDEVYIENSFAEIRQFCSFRYIDLVQYIELNEGAEIWDFLKTVWDAMKNEIAEGLSKTGDLPGPLHVHRKAKFLLEQVPQNKHAELVESQLVCSYAYACSEQNADNGTVVTAPTCGSCGVLPAVLYYLQHKRNLSDDQIIRCLGVAGLFGELAKRNASVSGAECGCQAEVGVACSMAAAAAGQAFGYNIDQIEYAAEVALEHHLGLTCDPICGLVQIPCIERNAVAAMRALNAANIAFFLTGTRNISYDMVLKSMYYTGLDMNQRYRETSEGGLAKAYSRRGSTSI